MEYQFQHNYAKYKLDGIIKNFDEKFYHQFDGMYFQGLPIYHHLKENYLTQGRCYDASATLGLAFGKEAFICRGKLLSMSKAWGKGRLGHGWVEKGGYCYDTTWKIACPRNIYYKVFKPIKINKISYDKFFDDCKSLRDWTIRDKEWYENNYSSANLIIMALRSITKKELEESNLTKEQRAYLEKLLLDLPDEYKAERPETMKHFIREEQQ